MTIGGLIESQAALGRKAVACKRFRWLPGMLTLCGGRVIATRGSWLITAVMLDEPTEGVLDEPSVGWRAAPACLPDLSDPPTLGCMPALVCEAWGDPDLYLKRIVRPAGVRWTVMQPSTHGFVCGLYITKAETFVAALAAAPQPEGSP